MSLSRNIVVIAALMPLARPALAESNDVILGFGGETDTASGRAVAVFADIGVADATWLSATIAGTRTGGFSGGLQTLYADLGFDHWFDPIGFRIGGGYWGDDALLDSNDFRASVYFRNRKTMVSVDYEWRDFDFTIVNDLLPAPRVFEFSSEGYGLSTRFEISDAVSLSLGGMSYGYSRDINLQPNIDVLRRFSTSRLGLMNSLLDYRVTASIDRSFGPRSISLVLEQWQTAIDQGIVNSVGAGILTPMGNLSDLEFRLSFDESDDFGSTLTLSAFFYFFGI
jgi:hypothetical protein